MDLAEYMRTRNISDAELADKVKRDRTTVSRWRLKKTRPDWEALGALETITRGKVTAKDFVPQAEAAE